MPDCINCTRIDNIHVWVPTLPLPRVGPCQTGQHHPALKCQPTIRRPPKTEKQTIMAVPRHKPRCYRQSDRGGHEWIGLPRSEVAVGGIGLTMEARNAGPCCPSWICVRQRDNCRSRMHQLHLHRGDFGCGAPFPRTKSAAAHAALGEPSETGLELPAPLLELSWHRLLFRGGPYVCGPCNVGRYLKHVEPINGIV